MTLEDEVILTGYCRCLDCSRMVTAEKEGDGFFADCSYGSCPYQDGCTIARRLEELNI